jgi:hypothetical protein
VSADRLHGSATRTGNTDPLRSDTTDPPALRARDPGRGHRSLGCGRGGGGGDSLTYGSYVDSTMLRSLFSLPGVYHTSFGFRVLHSRKF